MALSCPDCLSDEVYEALGDEVTCRSCGRRFTFDEYRARKAAGAAPAVPEPEVEVEPEPADEPAPKARRARKKSA